MIEELTGLVTFAVGVLFFFSIVTLASVDLVAYFVYTEDEDDETE